MYMICVDVDMVADSKKRWVRVELIEDCQDCLFIGPISHN